MFLSERLRIEDTSSLTTPAVSAAAKARSGDIPAPVGVPPDPRHPSPICAPMIGPSFRSYCGLKLISSASSITALRSRLSKTRPCTTCSPRAGDHVATRPGSERASRLALRARCNSASAAPPSCGNTTTPTDASVKISSSPIHSGAFSVRRIFSAARWGTAGSPVVASTQAISSRPIIPTRSSGRRTSARSDSMIDSRTASPTL